MRPTDETPPTAPQPPTATTRSTTATAERDGSDGFTALHDDERRDTRSRWEDIEARFVDDPAGATAAADDLLGETIDRIVDRWHEHRSGLRADWEGDDASTEALRTTLKRYRSTLESLLTR